MRVYGALMHIKTHQENKMKYMRENTGMTIALQQINYILTRAVSDMADLDDDIIAQVRVKTP